MTEWKDSLAEVSAWKGAKKYRRIKVSIKKKRGEREENGGKGYNLKVKSTSRE